MKYLKNFEELFNYKKLYNNKTFTVYRGTDYDDPYYSNIIFFSISEEFAKNYGNNIYKVEIKPNKIFDSFNPDNWKLLFKWCGNAGVEDPYYGITYYTFEEMVENNRAWESDTWEIIESSMWAIPGDYDTILISEGGEVNFIVLDKDIIVKSELIKSDIFKNVKKIINYIISNISKEKLKKELQIFSEKIKSEKKEFKQVSEIIQTYYVTGIITKDQGKLVKKKLIDSLKISMLTGIWLIPGGIIWLIVILKLFKKFNIKLNLNKK